MPKRRFVSIVVLVLCAGCLAAQGAAARPQSAAGSDQTAGGTIFGRVLDDSTLTPPPAADVAVDAYDTTGTVVSSAWTGSDGSYTLSGLPAGTYKVGFAPVPITELLPQFYNHKMSLAAADPVTVTNGGYSDTGYTILSQRPQFGSSTTVAVGHSPSAVAAGDFNHDGRPDIAVTNKESNTVSVLLGNGDGTFQPAVSYPAGFAPAGIAVGDFNGDGNPDLAMTDHGNGTVTVLLGNGDGTFQTPGETYQVGSSPAGIAVADLDGDGNLDIVTADTGSSDINVLRGNGDGTFQPAITDPTASGAYSVAAVKLFGRAHPDLVLSESDNDAAALMLNSSSTPGTFGSDSQLPTGGSGPEWAGVSDLSGLGNSPYLISTDWNTSDVSVQPLNSDGTPGTPVTYPTDGSPAAAAVADFNQDGYPDVITANTAGNDLTVLSGTGDGSFNAPANPGIGGAGPDAIAAADLNLDGRADVIIANGNSNTITIALNTTPAPRAPTVTISYPDAGRIVGLHSVQYTSFSCVTAGSCVDNQGHDVAHSTLDTSTIGQHYFTVTASDFGGSSAKTAPYTVAGLPTETITGVKSGGVYTIGQSVPVGLACADGQYGPGIASCNATGTTGWGSSQQLDTTSAGVHTVTLTGTSEDGASTSTQISYTVGIPPRVTISAPVDGATYNLNDTVALRYQCLPGADNVKLTSCTASQKGPNLDTSTRGRFTFSVTATNAEGLTFTQTANYAVDPCDTSMTLDKTGAVQLTTTQYPNCIKDPSSYDGFGYGVKEVDGPYEINGIPFTQATYRTTLISPDGSDPNLTRSCYDDGSFPILFEEPAGGGLSCGDAYQQATMRLCLSPIHNDYSGVPQCSGNELDVPVSHGLSFGVNWTQVGIDGFDAHTVPGTTDMETAPTPVSGTGPDGMHNLEIAFGRHADGTRYAVLGGTITLPAQFSTAPNPAQPDGSRGNGPWVNAPVDLFFQNGQVYGNIPWNTTGAQGMRITVPQAYVGAMPVKDLCFAETNFGAQACPQPSGGNGFLVAGRYNGPCQADDPGHGSSPWNGGLSLQLPGVPGNRWIPMWGNLDRLDGGITGLAFSNNINLGSIGAVLCVGRSPDAMAAGRAPYYLAGSIGGGNIGPLNLPSNVASFDYDDTVSDSNPADYVPWRMSVTGPNFSFKGLSLSSPTVGINGSSQLDLSSGVSESWADGIFSVDGNVAGWVAPSQDKFSFTGSARACIKDIGCHHVGDFAVSSKGAAACADLSTNYGLFTISWHAGAGVYWDPFSVDIMPSSCGISDYQETRTYTVREIHSAASVSGLPIHVAPRQKLLVVRATGDGAPPKIALSSPDGVTRIVSPANSDGINDPGHDYLVENPSDNSTNVIVPMPAAGTWTLTPEDPAHPITDAQVAWYQPLPTVTGTVQGTGTRRAVVLRYTKPASDQILLDERGNRYGAIIANNVTGARCPGHPTHEGVPVMCARVPFRPRFRCVRPSHDPGCDHQSGRQPDQGHQRGDLPCRAVPQAGRSSRSPCPPPARPPGRGELDPVARRGAPGRHGSCRRRPLVRRDRQRLGVAARAPAS